MSATIEQIFLDELVAAAIDVFKTMVFVDIQPAPPNQAEPPRQGSHVVGTIAFTGRTNGLVAFYSTIDAARDITAAMLGMDAADLTDELPDAIGELTNMIAGSFRTRVAHSHNETWAISVPTVTIGSDFYTRFVSDVQRVLCPFRMGDSEVHVELIVTKRNV
jgi:chemotaxis protein CheX